MTDYTNETDLTTRQDDYAIFLPALSTFYALFVGRQRRGLEPLDENKKGSGEPYIPLNRIPSHLTNQNPSNAVESINWLAKEGLWKYKWSLHSAGHASLDLQKDMYRESQYRERDRQYSWLLGDSGGFQIGKGKWEGDWNAGSGCPQAQKKRDGVLKWMDAFMDYGMILDIPAWVDRSPEGAEKSNIHSYQAAVDGTAFNNEYFIRNRNGECKFLNVLQGENFAQADDWYSQMKKFCDPKQYPDAHFNGWAMGGQNMCDIELALKRLVELRHDGLLEEGLHDVMHFLGTSKLEWALVLTAVQRAVRKHHNPKFTVTFDCASPFLCTANGQFYTNWRLTGDKWSYMMNVGPDDKAYKGSGVPFDDVVRQMYPDFISSPMSKHLTIDDICYYAPGDVSRMGTETKTSWDSFAYCLLMNHNVWQHIMSVQEANKAFDGGAYPSMLVDDNFDKTEVKDVIMEIFAESDKGKSLQIIENYRKLWLRVIGTRGHVGKKTINSSAQFNALFE
tara:strand:- start:1353 stop:2867 length:1515 start_codon:yes stop_codon:yes gene_type:complete